MSAAALEQTARRARVEAARLLVLSGRLSSLTADVVEVVGGSSTGADRRLAEQLQAAASRCRSAAQTFELAAQAADRAAAQMRREELAAKTAGRGQRR